MLTVAPLPMRTPLELRRKILPFALRAPSRTLRSLPMTLLRVMEELLGWLKLTVSLGLVLKACQLMEAFWADWLILVTVPDWVMAAVPGMTTVPPWGAARAGVTNRNWYVMDVMMVRDVIFCLNVFIPLNLMPIMFSLPIRSYRCNDYALMRVIRSL
ncbi:MAG: hypothetical protein A4E57_02386 [Syntrophorhabdaceae bacterium PtaU1.Bin034]|nr:MAG: hypothetical protein A4E57_02386 [Syntrophorhabdaceae bacterium PtaU1.Bin034]